MKQHEKCEPNHRLSDWDEVWALIVPFVLQLSLGLAMIFMLAAVGRSAQAGELTGLDAVRQGSLLFADGHGGYRPALTQRTEVNIDVSGMIARAKVRQRFTNDSEQWVEGIYVFPLPEEAAVDHLRMQIGERVIEGRIEERSAAKQHYQRAKTQGKKAALIEQERPNLFTNSVANIAPHETVVVEIEYQQVLRYDNGELRLRFPMAITPRYIPGTPSAESMTRFDNRGWAVDTDRVPDASRITPPVWQGKGKEKINPITLTVHLDAGFPLARVASPYHAIHRVDEDAARGITTITLADTDTVADRDFELSWAPQADRAPRAALFTEQVGTGRYYLLMVLPPDAAAPQQRLPREVVFVIDTSGSMAGTSIRQAKQALTLALQRLRPGDRFNVISFNSSTDRLFGDARPATPENLEEARRYVSALHADGGTEMRPALKAALRHSREDAALRQVIFLTDGSVGDESELLELIHDRLGRSRLFTVGIGSAPNSHFMTKAAQFGRGTFTYIGDLSEVRSKMEGLFRKLDSPVMSDLAVDAGGTAVETYPQRLPDLYRGEPLVIAIKGARKGQVLTIHGRRLQAPWQDRIALQNAIPGHGVGVLWARRKIADLMDQQRQGADREGIRKAVIQVALQHHLVSKYTSLVAVDVTPSRPQGAALERRALPVNLPHGQQYEKIFGHLPQTATAAPLDLLLGTLLLLSALMVWFFTSPREDWP
ncbi:MAG: marine proteobacterial sortase target protein [Gammaproteobacteria bacterium]